MPIYELTPVDLNDPDWKASTHHGPCLVRADNERNAKLAATLAFVIAVRLDPGADISVNPWNQPGKVDVHTVAEHGFDEDGPQTVLAPAGNHPTLEHKDGNPVH